MLRQVETDQGDIKHALRMTADATLVQSGFTGDAIAGDGSSGTGIFKEGARLGIPYSTAMPPGLSPLGQKVFCCLMTYGCFVTSKATGITRFQADPNGYDSATIAALAIDVGALVPLLQLVT
jgi:hypothetical protein